MWIRIRHANLLIADGYWIANCRGSLTLPNPVVAPFGDVLDISAPPPDRLLSLGHSRLELGYAYAAEGSVRLRLPVLDDFAYSAPARPASANRVRFRRKDLPGGVLAIDAVYPGPARGAWASLAGLGASALFFLAVRRRRAR